VVENRRRRFPNIAPKGQLNGSTINVTYDSANDPDCCESAFFVPHSAIWGRESVAYRTLVSSVVGVSQPAVSLCPAISETTPSPITQSSLLVIFFYSARVDGLSAYDTENLGTTRRHSEHTRAQVDGLRVRRRAQLHP
jgi:hypothetical protein